MQFGIKLLLTNAVIIFCVLVGKKHPALGGLIATMPLTSLLVLVWLYTDNRHNNMLMVDYTAGVLWGIIPTILFFLCAHFCFRSELPLTVTLAASFVMWLAAACVHQWLLSGR